MKGHDIVGGHGSKIWHEYFRKETIHLRWVQQNPTWTHGPGCTNGVGYRYAPDKSLFSRY